MNQLSLLTIPTLVDNWMYFTICTSYKNKNNQHKTILLLWKLWKNWALPSKNKSTKVNLDKKLSYKKVGTSSLTSLRMKFWPNVHR